jgi:hypothetical protein
VSVLGSTQERQRTGEVRMIHLETWIKSQRSPEEDDRPFRIEVVNLITDEVIAIGIRSIELDRSSRVFQRVCQ